MPSDNSPSLVHPPIGTLIDDDSLELVEVLGVGGYGVVYRAEDTCSSSPKSYAVKCLVHRHNPQSLRQRQIHIREIALHQLAGAHPNVVTLHRVIEDYNYTFIIMDYATDHDLFSQILHNCRYLGEDYLIKHVFLQLLDAVEYCHSLGIYHRDLKPENILCFDGGLRIAITDFGLATTDKVSEEFRTGSVYHMSPECQGGQFAPCGSYSPMANDIWSLGIILLNLATGRNPWKSASATDPTFQAYLRDPLNFLPTVLPISQEVNIILTRMLELDWRDRMGIPEIRQAIEDLDTFYSDGVIFEGSMARCPWEAGMEIDSDSSATKYEPVKSMAADLKSHWSQESEIVFAHHSPTTEGGWVDYPEYTGPVNAAYAVNPEDRASMYDDCGDLFTRARTPPSIESPCASETGSSYPVTPSSFDVSFGGRAVLPSRKQRKPLMIDTSCTPRHPRYYNGSDSLGTLSSDSSSIMETAVEEPTGHYDSTYFVRDLSQKPSPITMPQSVTLGDSGDTEDKEMASPTVWNCATADAPEIPSMYSSTRTSFTNTHLSFDHRSNAPSPDTMTWSDVEYHPDRQVPETPLPPVPPPKNLLRPSSKRLFSRRFGFFHVLPHGKPPLPRDHHYSSQIHQPHRKRRDRQKKSNNNNNNSPLRRSRSAKRQLLILPRKPRRLPSQEQVLRSWQPRVLPMLTQAPQPFWPRPLLNPQPQLLLSPPPPLPVPTPLPAPRLRLLESTAGISGGGSFDTGIGFFPLSYFHLLRHHSGRA